LEALDPEQKEKDEKMKMRALSVKAHLKIDKKLSLIVKRTFQLEKRKKNLKIDLNKIHKFKKFSQKKRIYFPKYSDFLARALIHSICYVHFTYGEEIEDQDEDELTFVTQGKEALKKKARSRIYLLKKARNIQKMMINKLLPKKIISESKMTYKGSFCSLTEL
jgi:hypothetical protein